MAWAYVQDVEDGSLEDYDRVSAELQKRSGDTPPQGLILHAVGGHGNGMRIIDVWESEDAYQRFREEQLAPAMEAMPGAMAQGPPRMEPLELHNLIRP